MGKSFKWQEWKGKAARGVREKDEKGGKNPPHEWKPMEKLLELGKCCGVVALFSWFFYRSAWAALPLCAVGVALWKKDARHKVEEDRRTLVLQFCDCICCADTAMRAGYSIENAMVSTIPDMELMYGAQSAICRELERIRRGLVVGVTLEKLLQDLGESSKAGPIREFADVLAIAKRSGGSMAEIIRSSSEMIHRQVEAEEEIRTQTAAKRMEQGIMNLMPFAIVLYLEGSNPGYFDMLFHNWQGNCIMSGCLAAYLGAYFLAEKLLKEIASTWG